MNNELKSDDQTSENGTDAEVNIAASSDTLMVKHCSLGHPGGSMSKRLVESGAVLGLSTKLHTASAECEPCQLSKARKSSFKLRPNQYKPTQPGKGLAVDCFGPIGTPGPNGERTALVMTDEAVKLIKVIMVETKDEVPQQIINWVNTMKTKFGYCITNFYSDNGTEFVNGTLKSFFTSNGIIAETSAPYTPQPNGLAEASNKIIITKARTMMKQANSPKLLWVFAVEAAAYLHNRTHIKQNESLTPYQLFEGMTTPINLHHLKVWGCDVVIVKPKVKRDFKLGTVAVKTIMLGYSSRGSYRVLDPNQVEVKDGKIISFKVEQCSNISKFNEMEFTAMEQLKSKLFGLNAEGVIQTEDDEDDDLFENANKFENKASDNDVQAVINSLPIVDETKDSDSIKSISEPPSPNFHQDDEEKKDDIDAVNSADEDSDIEQQNEQQYDRFERCVKIT